MTTTFDPPTTNPRDPLYLDEADTRLELARTFDVCGSCRQCVSLCGSFSSLFDLLDRPGANAAGTSDAGSMTPAEQDGVITACSQCKLCAIGCPHTAEQNVDVPRLMLRAAAMRADVGLTSWRDQLTAQIAGRSTGVGRVGSVAAPLVNRVVNAEPDSLVRRIASRVTGVSAVRLLAPYARERFTTWFAQRPKIVLGDPQGKVVVLPTCIVDYHEPDIGKDLVKVYERNGIECELSGVRCCGAPWLQAGDIDRFADIADSNVEQLADEIRAGAEVVVPQPTCALVLTRDYVDHVTTAERRVDAELVAERTFGAAEYLMRLHRADDTVLDTDFDGRVARAVTYHVPCHTRAQEAGFAGRDLLQLTGARVRTVHGCSGANGIWGLSAEHEAASSEQAAQLAARLGVTDDRLVVGDCHRANTTIVEQSGGVVVHPLQALARAYGIPTEH